MFSRLCVPVQALSMRAALVALLCVAAASASSSRVVMSSASLVSSDWALAGPASADAVMPLGFAIKQKNVEKLNEIVDLVSDPNSHSYGKVR